MMISSYTILITRPLLAMTVYSSADRDGCWRQNWGRQYSLSPLSAEDIDRLLTLVENKIPVQDEDWDELTHQFNQVPKPTGDPNCPEEVKRAKRAKWQINARSDAEDMNDKISEESDGRRATFDDSAEWDKEDEDDEDNSAMSGSIKGDWTITKKNMSDKDQFEETMNEDQEDAENLENTTRKQRAERNYALPPRLTGLSATSPLPLTPEPSSQVSSAARKRFRIDRALKELTKPLLHPPSPTSGLVDIMMMQMQQDRENRNLETLRRGADRREDAARREEDRKEEAARRAEERRDKAAQREEERKERELNDPIVSPHPAI
uniref:RxLR effector candidate protein n=1 Tax=Hyaloperonospora arabidopsidis (strain Emoy2) TaxID=559515 RepID=M4BF08_HYAAE